MTKSANKPLVVETGCAHDYNTCICENSQKNCVGVHNSRKASF